MHILFAATALGTVLLVLFGILLGLIPFTIARRRRWDLAAISALVAGVIVTYVGGLVVALPAILVVICFYLIFGALARQRRGWRNGVHVLLGGVVILAALQQYLHLPLRIYLRQSTARIAGNIAGIALWSSVALAFIESRMRSSDKWISADSKSRPKSLDESASGLWDRELDA